MSLGDCPKCWDRLCSCGHMYEGWPVEARLKLARVLVQGVPLASRSQERRVLAQVGLDPLASTIPLTEAKLTEVLRENLSFALHAACLLNSTSAPAFIDAFVARTLEDLRREQS